MLESNPTVIAVPPTNCFRLKLYQIVNHKYFDNLINVFILCNMVFLCMDYQGASKEYD
jgi:hypothetical protein